jgi:error-prone DNA polymerase
MPIGPAPEKPPLVRGPSSDAYVELSVRSNFSFLRGGSSPEALVRRAAELGHEAIAITDFAGLYGAVRAMVESEETKIRLILGCDLPIDDERTLLLHVENHVGYTHLCELLSEAHRSGPKLTKNETARTDVANVARRADGLFCTAPESLTRQELATLKDAFGDRLSIGVHRHLDGEDVRRELLAVSLARDLGIAIVAHNAVRFAAAEHKQILDVLHCIRKGVTLDAAGRELLPNAEARLVSPGEMVARFADHPEWVARTREIAAACTFRLRELAYKFPCEVPAGETSDSLLRKMTYAGARDRYPGALPEKVSGLIEKELALIAKLEVATYFLSVRTIVDIARERDILCQGRGSAANSAVCFCLGITAVDPARSSLLFERFLSAERREPPDIDVDFEHERREEVIQEIYRRYGRDRAAMVSEVICYRGKSALREVGKVFGFSLEQVDRLSSIVTWWDKLDEATIRRLREAGFDPNDGRVKQCLRMAAAIQGYPRHLSIHVGGFILSAEPLERIAPVEPATMKDRTVVPWDKDDIDVLGFFKVDVLGLGMLTAIRKALIMMRDGVSPIFVNDLLANIPAEDPVVYDALCRADSVGVFQIESRAQMSMLPRLLPRSFYDLVIEVAIVRPGPIQGGMVHPYLRRRNKEEPVDVPHALLEPILERTLGVPLFQEQVMQIAIVGAGYSGGEADQLRRDMAAWRRNGKLVRHRERLHRGFAKNGISEDFGERLYKQIQGFGEYGFPESHAASFALLVYASAWIKVHHPAAFAAALINSQPMGFYSASTILQDAQRHGVELEPIRVECSDWDCKVSGSTIRVGLRLVKGLGEEAGRRVEKARPFSSVEDLRARAELDRKEMDALAEAGALNDLVAAGTREAMWSVRSPRGEGLFRGVGLEDDVELPALTRTEQLVLDFERTGISIADHPMRAMRETLPKHVLGSRELAKTPHGKNVTTAGLVICRQRPGTASGIVFVTLEDEDGFVNLVLWAKVFEQYRRVATSSGLLLVRGRVDAFSRRRDDGSTDVVYVIADHLAKLKLDRAGAPLPSMSRDFH